MSLGCANSLSAVSPPQVPIEVIKYVDREVIKVVEKRTAGIGGATVVQTRARHILLRPSAQLSEVQARARLADLRQRITSGTADFASLAREFSQDGSAAGGGDLGWASPGQFVPEFEEVMADLRPGGRKGWHIEGPEAGQLRGVRTACRKHAIPRRARRRNALKRALG